MNTSFRKSDGAGATKTTGLILASIILTAGLHSASAQVLYSTGFENPPFANGSTLLGQDGWSLAIPPFLNPNAAVISTAGAQSGLQSVRVRGVDLLSAVEVTPEYDAVGSFRKPLGYDAGAGLPIVRLRAGVRLDGPTLGAGDFFAANLAARSGDGGVGELGISSDGFVYGYTGNFGSPQLFSTPVTLGAWHTIGIDVNFATDTYSFTVDAFSSASYPFESGFTSDLLVREALVTYAKADGGGNLRSNYAAYYDNVSATATPEPTSVALLAFGCIALAGVRRRPTNR